MAKIDASRYAPAAKMSYPATVLLRSIATDNGVLAYPTIKLFVDGSVFDFEGQSGRSSKPHSSTEELPSCRWQHIVKWVNRHLERDHILKSAQVG